MEKPTNTTESTIVEADKKIANKNKTGALTIGALVLTGAAAVATGGGEGIGDNIPPSIVNPIGSNLYEGITVEEYTPLRDDPKQTFIDVTPNIDREGLGEVNVGGTHERPEGQVEFNDGQLGE